MMALAGLPFIDVDAEDFYNTIQGKIPNTELLDWVNHGNVALDNYVY